MWWTGEYPGKKHGGLAQLARASRLRKSGRSSSQRALIIAKHGGLAQLARAPALQAGGRRFDSDILHVKGRREKMRKQ
jgi:hypothetical protein